MKSERLSEGKDEGPFYNFDFTVPLDKLDPIKEGTNGWSPFAASQEPAESEMPNTEKTPLPEFDINDWQPAEWSPPAWEPEISSEEISKGFVPSENLYLPLSPRAKEIDLKITEAYDNAVASATFELPKPKIHIDDNFRTTFVNFTKEDAEARNPTALIAETPQELQEIIQAAYDRYNVSHITAEEQVEHEMEHIEFLKSVHPEASYIFGLNFEGSKNDNGEVNVVFRPVTLPRAVTMTNLELAGFKLYPSEPSDGDKEQVVTAHSYLDIDNVVRRLKIYDLPLPKWHQDNS